MSNIITKESFNYGFDEDKCNECEGNCCIGESGFIWITPEEMKYLSVLLEISIDELKEKYLNKINYKFSIKEKKLGANNYACHFFDTKLKQCSVYEARPKQCRTFPFWDYFKNNEKEVYEECPAIKNIL